MLSDATIEELRKAVIAMEGEVGVADPSNLHSALDELIKLRSFAYDCIRNVDYWEGYGRLVLEGMELLGVKNLSADTYADAPRREP